MIRRAGIEDLADIVRIYNALHDLEEAGAITVGWRRDIYPTEQTAKAAIEEQDLFVLEEQGYIVASARINKRQMPAYRMVKWRYEAPDEQVMVLHTLTVDPAFSRRGYASSFISFYENYAAERGCTALRLDTNSRNAIARMIYSRHGYIESGVIPCNFNGIPGVELVCMEKRT